MFINCQPAIGIKRQTIRSGLKILADVHSRIAALGSIDRDLSIRSPTIDRVLIRVTEEKIASVLVSNPDRTFRERETVGKLFDLWISSENRIQFRIPSFDFCDDLPRIADTAGAVEVQCRRADPNVIRRWIR